MSDPAPKAPPTQLDPENPWPGLESFEEAAHDYFHGREAEADALLRRVVDSALVVLFGKSGLGKTSLLKAGLFPRLRWQHFLPVYVRLSIRPDAPALVDQLHHALHATIDLERVDAPATADGETLWEYLHRATLELWSPQNFPLVPVFVLDQFEELFTIGGRVPEAVERFQIDLGDLAENRIPSPLVAKVDRDPAFAAGFNLRQMPYKIVMSLREDFLPDLENWRQSIPSLGRSRARLLPMDRDQAFAAVHGTASHLMDPSIARRIVDFVAAAQATQGAEVRDAADQVELPDARGEIEPALLSLFCRGLNDERRRRQQARFDEALLEGAQQGIIAEYYRSCVDGLPESVSRFIETELITERGFRNSYARDDAVPAHLADEQLEWLINRRLLRVEEHYGAERIELTHDLLTRAVVDHRTVRRQQDAERDAAALAAAERTRLEAEAGRQRNRFRVAASVAVLCLFLAGGAGYFWWQAAVQRVRADEALRESQARDLASQSQVVGNANPVQALELAVRAVELEPAAQSELALRLALARSRLRAVLTPPAGTQFVNADVARDGGELALVRSDGVVEIRSFPALALLHSRTSATSRAASAFFGATEGHVVVAGPDHGVAIWEPAAARDTAVLPPSPDPKTGWLVRVDGAGQLLIGDQARVVIVDPGTGMKTAVRTCDRRTKPIAVVRRDRQLLLAFSDAPTPTASNISVCEAFAGRLVRTLRVPTSPSGNGAAFSTDGRLLAVTGMDETVRVWDVESGDEVATLRGFTAVPASMAFTADRELVVGVWDGMIEGWRLAGPTAGTVDQHDRMFQLHDARKPAALLSGVGEGGWILALDGDGTLRLWEGASRTPQTSASSERTVAQAWLEPDGRIATVLDNGSVVHVTPAGESQRLSTGRSGSDAPIVLTPSHDRSHLLLAWRDGGVQVWARRSGRLVAEFNEEHPLVAAVWATPSCSLRVDNAPSAPARTSAGDGCAVATLDTSHVVRLSAIPRDESRVRRWTLPDGLGRSGVMSPDGRAWIALGGDGAMLIDLASGQSKRLEQADRLAQGWPFTANGSLVTIAWFGIARLNSLSGGSEPQTLAGHATMITSAVVSPDGGSVLTSSDDWTAKLWDAERGALVSTMRGHMNGVEQGLFRSDGALVATLSRDRSVRVWVPSSGAQLFRFELPQEGAVRLLDFEGARILYSVAGRAVGVILCEPCLAVDEMARIARSRLNTDVP